MVFTDTFNPKFVEREYLDKFPGWCRVDVTTGWLSASVDGQSAVDARIQTDPERFWDHYQAKVLPRIYDHVMKVTDNRPLPDKQPFHRDLDVEVWMSEPDFRIGVDEELVSSLEALHEDLYFVTLDFFDALGRTTTRRRLAAPGKIFPIIHPERRGQAGRVHSSTPATRRPRPQLEVKEDEAGREARRRSGATSARLTRPRPRPCARWPAPTASAKSSCRSRPRTTAKPPAPLDALDALARLHQAGIFPQTLSFDHVDRMAVSVTQRDTRARRVLAADHAARAVERARGSARPALPLVTWDHVISPDEAEALVGQLSAFPEVKAYRAGQSYRGRDISVMEITRRRAASWCRWRS